MKRKIIPITVALLLISGLAYAVDKKKQTKLVDQLTDKIHEEEALQAELLAATEENQIKIPDKDSASSGKTELAKSETKKDQLKTKN
jgi:uncharacterized membrane protein